MARYDHLPIYKAAMDMTVYLEQIVCHFGRYHKYTIGSELRTLSRQVVILIIRANNAQNKELDLETLLEKLEEMKILFRIAKEVKAFNNFHSFEVSLRHLDSVTRQCVGWLKSQKKK